MGSRRSKCGTRETIMWALIAWRRHIRWKPTGGLDAALSLFQDKTGLRDTHHYLKRSKVYGKSAAGRSKWKRCLKCLKLVSRSTFRSQSRDVRYVYPNCLDCERAAASEKWRTDAAYRAREVECARKRRAALGKKLKHATPSDQSTLRNVVATALISHRKYRRWVVGDSDRWKRDFNLRTGRGYTEATRYAAMSKVWRKVNPVASAWKKCKCGSIIKRGAKCDSCLAARASKKTSPCLARIAFEASGEADYKAFQKKFYYARVKASGYTKSKKAKRRALIRGASLCGDARTFYQHKSPIVSCYWCGKRMHRKKAHGDHIIPLARGGAHAAYNLCWSCPTCNLSKSAQLPNEWAGVQQMELMMR